MKQIIIRVPDDLHREFKVWCAENGVTMQAALEWAIKELLEKGALNLNK
jgi:hypothetical protein